MSRVVETLLSLPGRPRHAALALVALCFATYLPGVIRLPAVDRTEIIFAETARDMVARGNWLDPRYDGKVHAFRPAGTFWAQGVAAAHVPASQSRNIIVYRLPGLISVTLAVLALYWLAAPVTGCTAALIASALFAVAPLTVILAQLAIAEGISLLAATVAMLAMMRIYLRDREFDTRRDALLLWAALGLGMAVNALQVPILVLAALLALYAVERDAWWLKKLHTPMGFPLALLIASPWLAVRIYQDGVPFSGLSSGAILDALGGSQDMKHAAWPGTFVLAAVLGFLPGTVLLWPALSRLWRDRMAAPARFLLAWIAGYLAYLELISGKPGTYAVQVVFPALAIAVGLLITDLVAEKDAAKKTMTVNWAAMPHPYLSAGFAAALLTAPFLIMEQLPPYWLVPPGVAVVALFYAGAIEGRAGCVRRWAVTAAAAFAAFDAILLAGVLPSIDKIWPARQIERALEGCPPGPMAVFGYREPSSKFLLRSDAAVAEQDALRTALVEGRNVYLAGEVRDDRMTALMRSKFRMPRTIGCVEAYNTMRGCPLYFRLAGTGDHSSCALPEAFRCTPGFAAAAQKARETPGCE